MGLEDNIGKLRKFVSYLEEKGHIEGQITDQTTLELLNDSRFKAALPERYLIYGEVPLYKGINTKSDLATDLDLVVVEIDANNNPIGTSVYMVKSRKRYNGSMDEKNAKQAVRISIENALASRPRYNSQPVYTKRSRLKASGKRKTQTNQEQLITARNHIHEHFDIEPALYAANYNTVSGNFHIRRFEYDHALSGLKEVRSRLLTKVDESNIILKLLAYTGQTN